MEIFIKLTNLLPKIEEIEHLWRDDFVVRYLLQQAIDNIENLKTDNPPDEHATEKSGYLVQCLVDKFWEHIHIGHFSDVRVETRKIYALANFFRIPYMLLASTSVEQVEKCSEMLDEAVLLGCTQNLYENSDKYQKELLSYFDSKLGDLLNFELPILEPLKREEYPCDVPQLACPSVEEFQRKCFEPQQPSLLLRTIEHWPAKTKWLDLNYINKVTGNRTVPIEIGSNYATHEWSQQMYKVRHFLRRQFAQNTTPTTTIEYLAQHELFDQIPELKKDILLPDYCCALGTQTNSVDIKAWLGPKGTISPMHYDPKHNLLCQVFGTKTVILAAPADTDKLYPHQSQFLVNTSRLDAANVDVEKFPLATEARFYHLHLQAGDCLYMPPKWWHYVRAESESFSVSFWWE